MPAGKHLIRSIELTNFLSFGESTRALDVRSLNVFIGPNACGKSNLIESIGLLAATPGNLAARIREGGGVVDWIWKGASRDRWSKIEVVVANPGGYMPLRYSFSFGMTGQRFELVDEIVENEHPDSAEHDDPRFYYRYQFGHPVLNVRTEADEDAESHGSSDGRIRRQLKREELEPNQTVLSQRKDPQQYPEITYLGKQFANMRLFQEWNLGRLTAPRLPQKADLPEDFLLPDGSNLGLVLNDLEHQPGVMRNLSSLLSAFNAAFDRVSVKIHGGTVQLYLHEKGLKESVPATRLSYGTLRYLCLLAILCHPSPPPVVCIEEPELGMHPDIIPRIAELLVEASERTQLFVTTHSVELVDALSEKPETIVICEKHDGATKLKRLQPADLSEWLKKYTLGELWQRGEIGGNRW